MKEINEVILCKYGEVILKGANKSRFEAILLRNLRKKAAPLGKYNIYYSQSTVFIEPEDDAARGNLEEMYDAAKKTFGFTALTRAAAVEKNMDSILEAVREYIPPRLGGAKTFKADAKRSDKRFPLKSPEIAGEAGAAVLEAVPDMKVNLDNPDIIVRVEIREKMAYIHAGQDRGAGGMPYGSSGRGLLLLSGGIDSPVAGHMIMRRGMALEAVYFESPPYTSTRAREKVEQLARIIAEWGGYVRLHAISLTHIQEEIRDKCDEDYFTLILRRFMMRIADRIAHRRDCQALITGESLAQVASQTAAALAVTDVIATIPVYRPCIGLDKQEIIERARAIGTYDTSVLPYEDCCTVFVPKHPRTQPELDKVIAQESRLDVEGLLEEIGFGANETCSHIARAVDENDAEDE